MVSKDNQSSLDGMIERMEREAFERYVASQWRGSAIDRDDDGYVNSYMQEAWNAWQARAALASKCRGVAHPGCNYLAPCGAVCDKCGAKT